MGWGGERNGWVVGGCNERERIWNENRALDTAQRLIFSPGSHPRDTNHIIDITSGIMCINGPACSQQFAA